MKKSIIIGVCIILGTAGSAFSAVIYNQWTGAAGDKNWNTAGNWNLGHVPFAGNGIDHEKAGSKTPGNFPVIDAGTSVPAPEALQVTIGGSGGEIDVNSGGVLNVTEYITLGASVLDTGILKVNGGTITCGLDLFVGQIGTGTLTIASGAINLTGNLSIADIGASANGTVHLNGGVISVGGALRMKYASSGSALLDVAGGTLVINGDQRTAISNFGSMITAYNGLGTLHVDYNNVTAGKTTVTATVIQPQASNPNPANGASNVAINQSLSWTAGDGAVSHNVYFGTVSPGDFRGNQSGTTFNPGALSSNTTYFWQIDEVNASGGVTAGNVWSFTTMQAKATSPNPANGAAGVSLNATLSWSPGGGAVSHDVYFGTESPGNYAGNQSGTTFNPGALSPATMYYWRIDEKDASNNITTGDVWSFTTVPATPAYTANPYLSWRNDPANSIVVNWWNPYATGDSSVEYGATSDYGSTVNIPAATNYHHVELTNLTPSTTYHYRVSSSDGSTGTDKTFTTADAMADSNTFSFSFAVFGDPRGLYDANEPYYSRHRAVCDWIASHDYKFALQTGDTVWAGAQTVQDPTSAQNYFLDFFDIEKNLSGSKVIMATMGSHETQTPFSGETVTYLYYYDLYKNTFPANGPAIDDKGRIYSFNYGNAHFVSLSSYSFGNGTSETPWLIDDLTAARANPNIKWIVVFMHAPLYTTNNHSPDPLMVASWAPVFEQYGVDLVFASHNHCYERSYPIRGGQVAADGKAPVYITNGMGGAEFNSTLANPLFAARYGSEIFNAGTLVTAVTVNGNSIIVDTIKNATGEPVDSFTIVKNVPCPVVDLDGDCIVDSKDLGLFFNHWLESGMWP